MPDARFLVAAARALLPPGVHTLGVLGPVPPTLLRELVRGLPSVTHVAWFGVPPGTPAPALLDVLRCRGIGLCVAGHPREAVLGADLVVVGVPLPLHPSWLLPAAILLTPTGTVTARAAPVGPGPAEPGAPTVTVPR
ncbi:hypothetical protein AB0M43_14175 [Longispora sp. NPDC051575]|uniref:hypothetical protein n=1 Tax=Longispora sp. NPDC051575 TaxID=3154943 RepID=UPI003432A2A0